VTNARFLACSFAINPADFALADNIKWRSDSGYSEALLDQFEASRMHHRIALAMRKAIREQYGTDDAYAAAIGMNRTRLGRLLGGKVVMRLEDVASARRNLGVGG
jgi:hypothetical protein